MAAAQRPTLSGFRLNPPEPGSARLMLLLLMMMLMCP